MISGEQIRQFREAQGWTLKQFAEKVGIHFLLLARIEKGTVKQLHLDQEAVLRNVLEHAGPTITIAHVKEPVTSIDFLNPPIAVTNQALKELLTSNNVRHSLDDCAATLADWICTLDPTWANRLQIMKDERGFTTTQALSTCIAYVLEHDLHMVILKHDALEPSPWRRGEKMECPECGTLYAPVYPGQPYCGNLCADTYRRRAAEQVIVT